MFTVIRQIVRRLMHECLGPLVALQSIAKRDQPVSGPVITICSPCILDAQPHALLDQKAGDPPADQCSSTTLTFQRLRGRRLGQGLPLGLSDVEDPA